MELTTLLNIKEPLIMAPMFLVSNTKMVFEGMKAGVAGCIPALNYRTIEELEEALIYLNKHKVKGGAFGFNLIVNKSNFKFKAQLEAICKIGCDFIITSLGNPKETIEQAHKKGIKVFCDVVNLEHAKKVEQLGADALIAVNNKAGGHRGNLSSKELIHILKTNCNIPIISAGGVGNKTQLQEMLSFGACGVSVGSPFIPSLEADISEDYKMACVNYGAKDIVLTEKISGTPCTVINTPYVKKIGTKQSSLEKYLNKNKFLKKIAKAIRFSIGMNTTKNAALKVTYKTVWVAGPSIENSKEILPVKDIIANIL